MPNDIKGYRKSEKHEICCAACKYHHISPVRYKRRMMVCMINHFVRVGALMTCDDANKPANRENADAADK